LNAILATPERPAIARAAVPSAEGATAAWREASPDHRLGFAIAATFIPMRSDE
jgi:hypothetical protein